MRRIFASILVVAGIPVITGCGQQPAPVKDTKAEIKAFQKAYLESQDRAEQVVLVKQLLADYPNHDYAGFFAEDIVKYYSGDLGQPDEAYRILDQTIAAADDPVAKVNLATTLAPVAAELGQPLDLQGLVAGVQNRNDLSFFKIQRVMDAAATLGDWDLEESIADNALARSTVETYRLEFPDRDYPEEELAEIVTRRQVEALAHKGWAVYNQDRVEEAMALFEESDSLAEKNYVGLAHGPLALYWGTAILRQGDSERAIEVIAPEAIYGDGDRAQPVLRQAWAATNGTEEDFDEFLSATRGRLAPAVNDFILKNYSGEAISLADIRRDKVTFLAFWFPT